MAKLPEGWSVHDLGDLAQKIEGGGTPPRNEPSYWDGDIPWASVKDLRGVKLSTTEESISELGLKNSSSKLIPSNTMIIASRMAVGKAAFFNRDVAINQDLKAFYPKKNTDGLFLLQWYLFQSKKIESLATGSTVKGIRLADLTLLPIDLPPLSEQQKIATILSSVDDVIEKKRAQIDKLKDLKAGMMQELLTTGIGHTEFKESQVGRIPRAWKVKAFGDLIGSMDAGVSVNGENRKKSLNEIGVLKVSSVSKGQFIPEENKTVVLVDVNRARINPKKDHILFSRANTPLLVGESAYIEKDYYDLFLPDKLWMINVKTRAQVNIRWLSYVLCSDTIRSTITEAATGSSSTMKNISKSDFLNIRTAIPPLLEQQKIVHALKSIDNRIKFTSQSYVSYGKAKNALMQELLTGKVRVK